MIFTETPLEGAYIVDPERLADERGFFARTWCRREFEANGLNSSLVQRNISYSQKKGTLRGSQHQGAPHAEKKLVRCPAGAITDVILDLRADSNTYKQWFAIDLSS